MPLLILIVLPTCSQLGKNNQSFSTVCKISFRHHNLCPPQPSPEYRYDSPPTYRIALRSRPVGKDYYREFKHQLNDVQWKRVILIGDDNCRYVLTAINLIVRPINRSSRGIVIYMDPDTKQEDSSSFCLLCPSDYLNVLHAVVFRLPVYMYSGRPAIDQHIGSSVYNLFIHPEARQLVGSFGSSSSLSDI